MKLLLLLLLTLISIPAVSAVTIREILAGVPTMITNPGFIFIMVTIFLFMLFYSIFAAGISRIAGFQGDSPGRPNRVGRITCLSLAGLATLGLIFSKGTASTISGPANLLGRIVNPFGGFGGIAIALLLGGWIYMSWVNKDGEKSWLRGLMFAGLGMVVFGQILKIGAVYTWGFFLLFIALGIFIVDIIGYMKGGQGTEGGERTISPISRRIGDYVGDIFTGRDKPPAKLQVHVTDANDRPITGATVAIKGAPFGITKYVGRTKQILATRNGATPIMTLKPGKVKIIAEYQGIKKTQVLKLVEGHDLTGAHAVPILLNTILPPEQQTPEGEQPQQTTTPTPEPSSPDTTTENTIAAQFELMGTDERPINGASIILEGEGYDDEIFTLAGGKTSEKSLAVGTPTIKIKLPDSSYGTLSRIFIGSTHVQTLTLEAGFNNNNGYTGNKIIRLIVNTRPCSIEGRVIDSETKEGIPDADLVVSDEHNNAVPGTQNKKTVENGKFKFENLPTGKYTVWASHELYIDNSHLDTSNSGHGAHPDGPIALTNDNPIMNNVEIALKPEEIQAPAVELEADEETGHPEIKLKND